jgi:hypothetical protein
MLKVNTLERLLNMFHGTASPHFEDWTRAPELPVIENENPCMGLPTPSEGKRSAFAMLKEKTRLSKMTTANPKYKYLIRTIGLLGQALRISQQVAISETETQEKIVNSPFQTEDSGIAVNEKEKLLYMPLSQYISKMFEQARKPHAYQPLVRGYLNYAYFNVSAAIQLFEVIEMGLTKEDYNNIR